MSEKRVKAWAVVNRANEIVGEVRVHWGSKRLEIYDNEFTAKTFSNGERVVPVTIVLEEK